MVLARRCSGAPSPCGLAVHRLPPCRKTPGLPDASPPCSAGYSGTRRPSLASPCALMDTCGSRSCWR
eukprot:9415410-Alexandrium_andersonii.AAC.1